MGLAEKRSLESPLPVRLIKQLAEVKTMQQLREKWISNLGEMIEIGLIYLHRKRRITLNQKLEWTRLTAYMIDLSDRIERGSAISEEHVATVIRSTLKEDIEKLRKA